MVNKETIGAFIAFAGLAAIFISVFVIIPVVTGIKMEYSFSSGPKTECVFTEVVDKSHPNANSEIVYREPTKICQVEKITSHEFLYAYSYSYDFYKKYNKNNQYVVPLCNEQGVHAMISQAGLSHKLYLDLAIFNNKTMTFVCPDGSVANEVSKYEQN